jgi:hypothetical protein
MSEEDVLIEAVQSGNIIVLHPDIKMDIPHTVKTFKSKSCIRGAGEGVFANQDINAGEAVTYFAGKAVIDSEESSDYAMTVKDNLNLEPMVDGKIIERTFRNQPTLGAFINEPVTRISDLHKKSKIQFLDSSELLSKKDRDKCKYVSLFPNVIIYSDNNNFSLNKTTKQGHLKVTALRDISKNEELLLYYGPTYEPRRKEHKYDGIDADLLEAMYNRKGLYTDINIDYEAKIPKQSNARRPYGNKTVIRANKRPISKKRAKKSGVPVGRDIKYRQYAYKTGVRVKKEKE